MRSHPHAAMQDPDRFCGHMHIHLLVNQCVGHAIEVPLHFEVIVHALFPTELIGCSW